MKCVSKGNIIIDIATGIVNEIERPINELTINNETGHTIYRTEKAKGLITLPDI